VDDRPEPPYPGYIERRHEELRTAIAEAEPLTSPHDGAPPEITARLADRVETLANDLIALSHDLHAHPELGFEEHHATAAVAALLDAHGHDVDVGAHGVATALRAEAGGHGPRVAVLAEYDALPGIGHGCGHNVICATAVGAFLTLADEVDALGGRVVLLGTPAEEGGGGKELLARAGAFDDVEVALMVHPWGSDVAEHPWLGRRRVEVAYRGLPAHASAMPYLGRNALDAVVHAYNGIALLRQHLLPGDRVHGVITAGGQRPNVVPEHASASFYLRSASVEGLTELCERAQAIFAAAAAATGTVLDARWDPAPPYLPVRTNRPLAARYATNLAPRGRTVLPAGILPGDVTGSTDMGNVSVRIPAIHPLLAIGPPEVAVHTAEFAELARGDGGDLGVLDGAFGLATTGADYLADARLRAAVADDFARAGGPVDVEAFAVELDGAHEH
jgi:amidohydrolase